MPFAQDLMAIGSASMGGGPQARSTAPTAARAGGRSATTNFDDPRGGLGQDVMDFFSQDHGPAPTDSYGRPQIDTGGANTYFLPGVQRHGTDLFSDQPFDLSGTINKSDYGFMYQPVGSGAKGTSYDKFDPQGNFIGAGVNEGIMTPAQGLLAVGSAMVGGMGMDALMAGGGAAAEGGMGGSTFLGTGTATGGVGYGFGAGPTFGGASLGGDLGSDIFAGGSAGFGAGGLGTGSASGGSYGLSPSTDFGSGMTGSTYGGQGIESGFDFGAPPGAPGGGGSGGGTPPPPAPGASGPLGDLLRSAGLDPSAAKSFLTSPAESMAKMMGATPEMASYLKYASPLAQVISGLDGRKQSKNLQGQMQGQVGNMQQIQQQMALPDPKDITGIPGYQAGLEAVQRSMAAQGYQGSGNMMTALQKYGGDFYNQYVQQRLASGQSQLNAANSQLGAISSQAGPVTGRMGSNALLAGGLSRGLGMLL